MPDAFISSKRKKPWKDLTEQQEINAISVSSTRLLPMFASRESSVRHISIEKTRRIYT